MISKLWNKLRDRKYRKAFVDSQLKMGVPLQLHALRKKRSWSQAELAKHAGLSQGVISRAENPNYGNLTFNTVLEIAGGLDVGFIGAFVPFSKLEEWHSKLSEESVVVLSFDEEDKPGRERWPSSISKQDLDALFQVSANLPDSGNFVIVPGQSQRIPLEKEWKTTPAPAFFKWWIERAQNPETITHRSGLMEKDDRRTQKSA